MYNNLQHYFVKLSVFFVTLCETAITQSCAEKHKVTQRPGKIDDTPYHY
jgi:hypothetical protein